MCPKGSGPHSAAKQGRSFRVSALNHPGSICAHGGRGYSFRVAAVNSASPSINLKNMADFAVPNSVHKMCILAWARCQSRGPLLSFRVAPWVGVLSLRIGKWALECSCVPKGVGATFCSKTGPFFSSGCFGASSRSKPGPFFSCGCSKLGSES